MLLEVVPCVNCVHHSVRVVTSYIYSLSLSADMPTSSPSLSPPLPKAYDMGRYSSVGIASPYSLDGQGM